MTDAVDAVHQLIRQPTLRIAYLAALAAPEPATLDAEGRMIWRATMRAQAGHTYTVRAPCLLAQLDAAVASSTASSGGRTVPGSRLPLAADALDLWVEIVTSTHTWARTLGVDRRPYLAAERQQRTDGERVPGWVVRLWQWSGAEARRAHWDGTPAPAGSPPPPVQGRAGVRVPLDGPVGLSDRAVPPVGLLLRAAAAAAVAQAAAELADRMAYRAHGWATRIETMLAGEQDDERIYPIRGAVCEACGAVSASEPREDGETYRVPAVRIRFLPVLGGEDGQTWAYRVCLACGDNGWVEWTSESEAA